MRPDAHKAQIATGEDATRTQSRGMNPRGGLQAAGLIIRAGDRAYLLSWVPAGTLRKPPTHRDWSSPQPRL